MHDLTIVIVAYNAEQTIARAVRSALASGPFPILLVDDGSKDATVQIAEQIAGELITIVKQPQNGGVGAARGRALEEIKTPYGMWLDADDAIMPNRAETMLEALKAGVDIVYDGGVLIDDETGKQIKALAIPDFMFEKGAEVRCVERNWYPLLHCGFRVSVARSVGFDTSFSCAEDYDFLLRAIMSGVKIEPQKAAGYCYYHRAETISRDLAKTRDHVRRALEKYGLDAIEQRLRKSKLSEVEQYSVLAGMALYRQDYDAASRYAHQVQDRHAAIIPYGMNSGLFVDYIAASAAAAQGHWQQAYELLHEAIHTAPSEDLWNNLGVALHHLGEPQKAKEAFSEALKLMPGYYDAQQNLEADVPSGWTSHPLRRQSSRSDYSR